MTKITAAMTEREVGEEMIARIKRQIGDAKFVRDDARREWLEDRLVSCEMLQAQLP